MSANARRRVAGVDRRRSAHDADIARCARLRPSTRERAFAGRLVPGEPPADPPPRAAAPQLPLFAQRGAP